MSETYFYKASFVNGVQYMQVWKRFRVSPGAVYQIAYVRSLGTASRIQWKLVQLESDMAQTKRLLADLTKLVEEKYGVQTKG